MVKELLERQLAWPMGAIGLVSVAAYNWHQWQQDKELLARVKEPRSLPPLQEWPALPLVSVLVAAWNEAYFIDRHIGSFLALHYPHKELVLCAGGDDDTYKLAKRYEGATVKVLEQQTGEGKQRALARGFTRAKGNVIFLTDADCLLEDDSFERAVYPVASGTEQVCTGSSRPLDEQLENPFILTQAASQLYASLRSPDYSDGLLGRNCAISRDLLERSQGLEAPAPTGTDYVLAKVLRQHGARIRQVADSHVKSRYPVTAGAYIRQQRRWLMNVFIHGRQYHEIDEMRASLRTSLTGLIMLLLPLLAIFVAPLFTVWAVLAAQALSARLRYLHFAGTIMERQIRPVDVIWQAPLLLLDFVAWTRPLVSYVRQDMRWE